MTCGNTSDPLVHEVGPELRATPAQARKAKRASASRGTVWQRGAAVYPHSKWYMFWGQVTASILGACMSAHSTSHLGGPGPWQALRTELRGLFRES